MADDSPGWRAIFAYVCFALGAALMLFGIIRVIYWCIQDREDKKKEQYKRNLLHKYRTDPALKDKDVARDALSLDLNHAAIYGQPNRPQGAFDASYVNPAVLYEDANPPKIPERTYSMSNVTGLGDSEHYETIEKSMNIDQSGTATPASARSMNQPASARTVSTLEEREFALAALDHATAGEDSVVNTPRSFQEHGASAYMVSGDVGASVIRIPRSASDLSDGIPYSFEYKTYTHEALPASKEIEYTFVTSTH